MKRNKESFIARNKKGIITSLLIIFLLGGGILLYIASIKNTVGKWENKVYPGVKVYGVELGGMNKEEAVDMVSNKLTTKINEKTIKINIEDKDFEIKYADIESNIDIEEVVREAIEYGKDEDVFSKNSLIKEGVDYSVNTTLSFNEVKLEEKENEIEKAIFIEPINSSITISNENISIKPEVLGRSINKEELHKDIIENINPNPTENVEIVLNTIKEEPKIRTESLQKINGIISTYSDNYYNDGTGRISNMRLATEYVNGTLLMPGEEFSYNNTIGETTPERGYKEAHIYIGDKVEEDYGGGVCQISTALYRAAMRANLKSVMRQNHSMMVSYSKPSLDATVYAGMIDYKFVNTYNNPIYIEGYMDSNNITFNIYGNKEAMDGKTYDLVNEIIEEYPYEVDEIKDPELEVGKRVIEINGSNGYKSKGYLVTYQDGVEVSRALVSTDIYEPLNTKVKVGTKEVEKVEARELRHHIR